MPAHLAPADAPYTPDEIDYTPDTRVHWQSLHKDWRLCVPLTNTGDEVSGDHDAVTVHFSPQYGSETVKHLTSHANLEPGSSGEGQLTIGAGELQTGHYTVWVSSQGGHAHDASILIEVWDDASN